MAEPQQRANSTPAHWRPEAAPNTPELVNRLATEEDLDRLKDITARAVTAGDGTLRGAELATDAEKYRAASNRRLLAAVHNSHLTCIVAEGVRWLEEPTTIIGYCSLLWVEHTEHDDGTEETNTGMLPRVVQVRNKHFPGWNPPDEASNGYEPDLQDDSVLLHNTIFREYWVVQDLISDPEHGHRFALDMVLSPILEIADQERILTCISAWPMSDTSDLLSMGFEICEQFTVGGVTMARLRRFPMDLSPSSSKSSGDDGEEVN